MSRLFRVQLALLAAAIALAFALSACSKNTTTTPVAPTPPPPTLSTDTFTGVLSPLGASVFQFAVTATGKVSMTLTETGTTDPVGLGMSLGLWDSTALTCSEIVKNDNSQTGTVIVGTAEPGTFCARVYDVGNVVSTAGFSLEVIHP